MKHTLSQSQASLITTPQSIPGRLIESKWYPGCRVSSPTQASPRGPASCSPRWFSRGLALFDGITSAFRCQAHRLWGLVSRAYRIRPWQDCAGAAGCQLQPHPLPSAKRAGTACRTGRVWAELARKQQAEPSLSRGFHGATSWMQGSCPRPDEA